MREFHTIVQIRPARPVLSRSTRIGDELWDVLQISARDEFPRFPVSFEDVAAAWAPFPRLYLEPDGSFVWTADSQTDTIQLDGSLIDDGRYLLSMELKGTCRVAMLDTLLTTLGWPQQRYVFQLPQYGIYLSETVFRDTFLEK